MPSIIEILNTLNVNKTTKQHVEQIENLYNKLKVIPIKDFFNEDEKTLGNNPILNELKKTLESNALIVQNPSKEELEIVQRELQKKIKEIGQLSFIEKNVIITSLKNAQEELSGFVKQTQTINTDEKRKKAYIQTKDALRSADIEILKVNIKKNNNSTKDIAELYKLTNPAILGLVRAFSVKDEIAKSDIDREKNLTICINLIKKELKLPTDQDIHLSNLGKIPKWSAFKLSLNKKFEQNKTKQNAPSSSMTHQDTNQSIEELNTLHKENIELTKEVSELKEKITSLEKQLSAESFNIEENKLTENNDDEPTNSSIEAYDSLQNQSDEKITGLNNQLSQLTETNKTLTEEIDTNKALNVKQKQAILNLNSELEIKEKQYEEQLILQKNTLLKNTQALENSTKENEKLSEALTASSKTLAEKNQSLIKTESELNELKREHDQIKLQIEGLESTLKQTTFYKDGLLEQKEDEITKLNTELIQLIEQLKTTKADFSSNSIANDQKTLLLETKIKDKIFILTVLKNKLTDSEEETNQLKKEAAELKSQLDAKSQKLQENESQLKTLTDKFTNLSNQKNILEQNYQAQLAEHDSLKAQHALNIQNLEGELAKLQEKNTLTENENLGLQENVVTLKTNLQKEKIALEQKVAQLKTNLSALQKTLTSTEQDLEFQLNQTREEKKSISGKLEIVIKERDSFISKASDVLPDLISSDSKDYFTLVPTVSNKNFKGILEKIDLLKKQEEENEKKIEELQDQLEKLKLESDKKDAKIFELQLSNIELDDENTKTLTLEKDHLQKKVAFLTTKLIKLEQQNRNFAQDPIPPKFNLDFDFEDDDFQDDRVIDTYDSDNEEEADHYQSFAATQEELISTKAVLNKNQTELQQKIDEITQLKDQLKSQETLEVEMDALKRSFGEAAETLSVLKSEKGELNKDLNDAQEILRSSKFEIAGLQVELEKLQKNDSSKQEEISELTNRFGELNKIKLQQEGLIEELNEKLNEKENIIGTSQTTLEELDKELKATRNQVHELEIAKNGLVNQKLDLESQITELTKKNTELQNDELVAKLHYTISTYENKLFETEKEIETLKEKLETSQKDDSNLIEAYDSLDRKLSEKNSELNIVKTELEATKNQLKKSKAKIENLNKNSDQIKAASQLIQEELTNFKKEQDAMKDGISLRPNNPADRDNLFDLNTQNLNSPHLFNSSAAQSDRSNTSSGNSSRNSSSSSPAFNRDNDPFQLFSNFKEVLQHRRLSSDEAFSEGSNGFVNDPGSQSEIPVFAPSTLRQTHSVPDLMRFNSDDSLDSSLPLTETTESPTVPITNPTNTGASMPRQKQQGTQVDNTSSIHERGVINAFKKENHEEIRLAFTAEFSRVATAAANLLFNENIVANADLPTFKNELDEKASEEIKHLIFALSNKKELLSEFIEKIHTEGLNASTYLEEVKNSASFIFGTLKIKRQGEADQTYIDYIKDIGENLLIKLCTENLQTEKDNLLQLAKRVLKNTVTINNLQPAEHTETIKIAAEELVTNILKADKLKSIIEDAKNDPTAGVNLLEASNQKLQEHLEQEVDQTFDHYFPIVYLNPIFQKIKDGEVLSEEEIQKIPLELQYADKIEDFVSGLRVKYSHLPSDYEGKVDDDNFKNLRLILRKKALADTNQVILKDNEIIDLDAKAWLEKKLQLITGKSVNLELIKLEKKQEDLLKELSSSLQVSTFYDIAITRKTIPELTQEIEKANKAQSSAAQQISQIFKGIENKQTSYPKLIDDEAIAGFEANINQHLENSSLALAVNNEQAKILLMGINRRLKKDISKWGFLDNKLQKEITSDIANTNGFPFDETATEKLVQHAMLVLRDNYPNETIEKRKQWLKDIALLHAITKKLALFSPKIKENIAKFEDLQVRKEEDINQLEEPVANKIADAVYLPHRHTIIANSLDPNLAKRLPADFELLDGAFYKQDPLQIGQTLTFALSLHNGEEQKCSVTRDETCLAYKIHTPWLNIVNKIKDGVANKMTYARSNTNSSKQFNTEEETLFTLLTHAVNSSKGPTHTIMLGKNCSNEKERFIRLFVEKFNAEQKLSSKKTILLANANDKLKIHSDDKKTIYNKIHKANSLTEELDNATTRTIDTLNRHITRPRG